MKIRTLHCSLVPRTSENTAWYTVYTLFAYVHNCKSQENNLVHVTWKQGYIRCYSSSSFSETVELDLGQKKSSTVSLRRSVDSIVFIVVGLLRFILVLLLQPWQHLMPRMRFIQTYVCTP